MDRKIIQQRFYFKKFYPKGYQKKKWYYNGGLSENLCYQGTKKRLAEVFQERSSLQSIDVVQSRVQEQKSFCQISQQVPGSLLNRHIRPYCVILLMDIWSKRIPAIFLSSNWTSDFDIIDFIQSKN